VGERQGAVEDMVNGLDFYKDKSVLVTGHTGFKGTWLCKILELAGAKVSGYALPSPTEDGAKVFTQSKVAADMYSAVGDIRNFASLKRTFLEVRPEIVFHLAAQPIVRESYKNPLDTYATNVMGTVNLLECVRTIKGVKSLVNVTTDKVYDNNEQQDKAYGETDPLDGYDPYANSKSCSELATHSYQRCFFKDAGVAVSTVRAGNVIGGGDFAADRILPDCIRAAYKQQVITVRHPLSIRPYQHVLEALHVYLLLAQKQYENYQYAGYYNVGPADNDCVNTGQLVNLFCQYWGGGQSWQSLSTEGPHEAKFLRLDCTKLKTTFNWKPRWHLDEAVAQTVAWAKVYQQQGNIAQCMEQQIDEFWQTGGM